MDDFRTRRGRLRGFSINRLIPNMLTLAALCSGLTAIRFGLQGPCSAVATACASAANAIGDAFKWIQAGWADVMITGGSEAAITHMGLGGFASMRASKSSCTRCAAPLIWVRNTLGKRPMTKIIIASGARLTSSRWSTSGKCSFSFRRTGPKNIFWTTMSM